MRLAGGALSVALLAALLTGMPIAHATTPQWTPKQAPGPVSDSTGNHLNAIDCWAPGNCVAVGYHSSGGVFASFVDKESNGSWSYVHVTSEADLTAVSCPAAGACVAVGINGFGTSSPEGVLEVQSGSTWTEIAATGPEGLYSSYTGSVTGVSCPVTGSCAAVGQAQSNSEVSTGFLLTLEPGSDRTKPASWAHQQAPESSANAGPNEDAGLAGVSCVSAGNCRAVGFALAHNDSNSSDILPLVDDEKNYAWAYGGSPTPSDATSGQLNSVSCVAGSHVCMAAGNYDSNQYPDIATIDTSTDSSSATSEALPAPFTSGELLASSCAPDSECQSVGQAYANSGSHYGYNGFIVSEKYGAGTPSASAVATDSPNDANSVQLNETLRSTSCVSGGFCVSVGSYVDNSGPEGDDEASVIDTRTYNSSGAITSESDIKAPEPANDTSDDDQNILFGVSCNSSTHCATVGGYFNDDDDQARGVIDTLGSTATPPPVKAPTVTKVRPSHGRTAGGKTVTLTGSHFGGASGVKFGSTSGTHLHIISSTELTVKSPRHGAGRVDVRVTNDGGKSAVTKSDRYTFVAPPSVKHISPSSGSHLGGEMVVIRGKDLSGATKVRFGSAKGKHLKVVSSKRLHVEAPAHSHGRVDVRVTTAGGTSKKVQDDHFDYT